MLEAAASPPALIVMIGRRRVGKSFLLARTFTDARTVSLQGDEQSERRHLELLAGEAGRTLLGTDALSFATWEDALRFFGEQARREPLTLILDEFQWLKAAQSALDSIIQRHWDQWDRDGVPITLVLSGSALTLMERLLDRAAPLFGRATARPRLQPLDYRESAAFAGTSDPVELLRRWAVLGGTPQYQLWAGEGALEEIIAERILAKDSSLYDDPRHLLREGEGIRDPGTYLAILGAVAKGATHHNEIAQQAGVPTGNLARKLERLEDLGYVAPRYPLAADGIEDRSSYQIADPYFRFWFRYVANNRSRLESGRIEEVRDGFWLTSTTSWAGPSSSAADAGWEPTRRRSASASPNRSGRGGHATVRSRWTSSACASTATCWWDRASGGVSPASSTSKTFTPSRRSSVPGQPAPDVCCSLARASPQRSESRQPRTTRCSSPRPTCMAQGTNESSDLPTHATV